MKAVRVILSSFLFVLSFGFFVIFVIGLFDSALESSWIGLVLAVVLFFVGYVIKGKSRAQIRAQVERESLREQGVIATSKLHHIEGLPLGESTQCHVSVTPTSLIIDGGGTKFTVNISQIRAAEVKTDVEIANIVHSSAAKGIAGGLLFGPIGLVVGSRATNKVKKTFNYYLIINFVNSNGELSAMMFDGGNIPLQAQRISNSLGKFIKNTKKEIVQL